MAVVLQTDPTLRAEPGHLELRREAGALRVPSVLGELARAHGLGDAEELLSWLSAFPTVAGRELRLDPAAETVATLVRELSQVLGLPAQSESSPPDAGRFGARPPPGLMDEDEPMTADELAKRLARRTGKDPSKRQ